MRNLVGKCAYIIWPYTESNVCIRDAGHEEKYHLDELGREFDHTHHVNKEPQNERADVADPVVGVHPDGV